MALDVEDGTGKSTAESYISVSDASAYHSARGNSAWAALATDALREEALRRATDYMVQIYRMLWKGVKNSSTQALDWPRSSVYLEPVVTGSSEEYPNLVSSTIVPTDIERACAELALKSASATLYADQTQQVVREKIGPIETEYDTNSQLAIRYKAVDAILAPYLKRPRGTVATVRR